MIDDLYIAKMNDLEGWADWNSSDEHLAYSLDRDVFIFRKLRGFVAALTEFVGYQQQLEGRMPGDPDEKSTFPFPDSLADRVRLNRSSSLIIPVGKAIIGGRIIV